MSRLQKKKKIGQIKDTITAVPAIPEVVTAVLPRIDIPGRLLTVAREPHANNITPVIPRNAAKPILSFSKVAPDATNPPNKTKTTPKKNQRVIFLPSKNISKEIAATGIVATVNAAMTGDVNDCSVRIKKEPTPNPVAPIQKPLIHLAALTSRCPSITTQIKNIKMNANTFRAAIILTTSQSFNKYSAAGKPVAKSSIEKTQRKFDLIISELLIADTSELSVLIDL